MAKEATKSFVLRVDAATMEAVERWAADEFRSTNGQLQWIIMEALRRKRPPEKITGRETGAETRKRVNLCESVLCGGVPAATAGSLGSGENGSK